MCGLTGFWHPEGCPPDEAAATVRRMADTLTHRGPDDARVWVDEAAGLALGHRLREERLYGRRNWQYLLWDMLMWEAWRRHAEEGAR